MKLFIGRCSLCSKIRLVDKSGEKPVCFACKQHMNKKKRVLLKP